MTFALIAYNQERFIREAVEGALAQTYSPLQVILSDDCSSDRSFEIMQEMAMGYNGPHEILLRRNDQNLGLARHVNGVMQLAKGELIVVAAGDDVSLSRRVERTYRAWCDSGKGVISLSAGVINILESGCRSEGGHAWAESMVNTHLLDRNEILVSFLNTLRPSAFGCSHAWHKDLFTIFGPLQDEVVYEDKAISFRAHLMDGITWIEDDLVMYRRHDGNIANKAKLPSSSLKDLINDEVQRQISNTRHKNLYQGFLIDAHAIKDKGIISCDCYSMLNSIIENKLEILGLTSLFAHAPMPEKIKIVLIVWKRLADVHTAKYLALMIFPKWLYMRLMLVHIYIRGSVCYRFLKKSLNLISRQ